MPAATRELWEKTGVLARVQFQAERALSDAGESWDAVIGPDGAFVGMSHFGASAPHKDLYRQFGITPEAVVEAAFGKLAKD